MYNVPSNERIGVCKVTVPVLVLLSDQTTVNFAVLSV